MVQPPSFSIGRIQGLFIVPTFILLTRFTIFNVQKDTFDKGASLRVTGCDYTRLAFSTLCHKQQ